MLRVYMAMEQELVVASEQEGRWRASTHFQGMQPVCLAADPHRPELVYCGTYARGLYKSVDAGASWRPVGDPGPAFGPLSGKGITSSNVMAVAVSATEQSEGSAGEVGVVYAGTEPSALFRSDDGGESWREYTALQKLPSAPSWSFPPRPATAHVRWILPDPTAPATLYVSLEQGALVKSADGGHTFADRQLGAPRDMHTLAAHPDQPHRLYAAAGDGSVVPGTGYAESWDGGASWLRPDEGLAHHYLWGVAVDPAGPDTVVVSAAGSPYQAHFVAKAESFVYRKTSSQGWQQVGKGLPEPAGTLVSTFATHPGEPHTFYVLSNKGLFRSANAGESWQRLEIPWPERYLAQHSHALLVTDTN